MNRKRSRRKKAEKEGKSAKGKGTERGTAELDTGGRQLKVAPVVRNSEAEKGKAGKLSTEEAGREVRKDGKERGKGT